jgi:hypothetical protein
MKTYLGFPRRTQDGGFLVMVEEDGKMRKTLDPKPSQRLINHSPDGFAWGYGGSGPAQLALAILLDVTGDREKSMLYYQQFKGQVIADMDMNAPWSLTSEYIEKWLKVESEVWPVQEEQ